MLMKQALLLFHNFQHQQQEPPLPFFGTEQENMSNLTSASGEASVSSTQQKSPPASSAPTHANPSKKKRSLPGNPDPDAEVIRLSPKSLLATNRFMCEICGKGFQRDQNLQLHRRGHNLPWKLKQRSSKEVIRKKVYVCPEPSCVHHDPVRALGDLTGIKKHFCRKHGEKKWKCDKCSKKYAVQSDWKAHSKTCGTREYRCDCGTLFSRRDSFITHRAFCDALAEESARAITSAAAASGGGTAPTDDQHPLLFPPVPEQQQQSTGIATHDDHLLPFNSSSANSSWTAAINAAANGHVGFPTGQQYQMQDPLKREQQQQFSLRPAEIPSWLAPPSSSPLNQPQPQQQQLLFPRPAASMPPATSQDFLLGAGCTSAQLTQLGGAAPHFQLQLPRPPSPSAHMSATALLQRAAQMGATMSKPAQTRSAPAHEAPTSPHGFGRLGLLGPASTPPPPPAIAALADEGVMSIDGSFEEAFGGMFGGGLSGTAAASVRGDVDVIDNGAGNGQFAAAAARRNYRDDHCDRVSYRNFRATAAGTDGMTTRDFLGLRGPISEGDILSMAGLDPCMNSSAAAPYDKAAPPPPPHQAKDDCPWNL